MYKNILLFNLYLLLILQLSIFLETSILNLSFLNSFKYPYLIASVTVLFFFMMKNNIHLKMNKNNIVLIWLFIFICLSGTIFSMNIENSLFRGILAIITLTYIFQLIFISSADNILNGIFYFLYILTCILILVNDFLLIISHKSLFYFGNFKGVFTNANSFASFITLFMIPAVILNIIKESSSKNILLNYILLLNLFYFIFLTRSRSAILSLIIFFIVLIFFKFIYKNNNIRNKLKVFFVILSILIISFFNKEYIFKYLTKYEHLKTNNLTETRMSLWNDRLAAIKQKPLSGWGYGVNYRDFDMNVKKDWNYIKGETEKGNTILSIIEEFGGISGLIIILTISYLIFYVYRNIIYFLKNEYYLVSLSTIIAALVHVNFESWLLYFGNVNSFIFWLLLISILNLKRNHNVVKK